MSNTRQNCQRIVEIEEQIHALVKELNDLVKPTAEELGSIMEDLRDWDLDDVVDYCMTDDVDSPTWFSPSEVLDYRELVEEEKKEEAKKISPVILDKTKSSC